MCDAAKRTASLFSNTGDANTSNEVTEKESNKVPESLPSSTGTASTSDKTPHTKTSESTVIQKPGQSVNVEIHVTVNTSPSYGSGLADLKKQRCGQRNSITSNSSVQETNGKSILSNGHFGAGSYDNPPSPSVVPRKYHGDPLEVVGERKKKRKCCIVM